MKFPAGTPAVLVFCSLIAGARFTGTATGAGWKGLPIVPQFTKPAVAKLAREVAASRSVGHRPAVFMKVGDSNTEMAGVLYGLGCERAKLPGRGRLRATVRRYNRVQLPTDLSLEGCGHVTSFSRRSNAVRSGTWSTWSMTQSDLYDGSSWEVAPDCLPQETPLACEARTIKPVFALVMTGTNDIPWDQAFGIDPGSETQERIRSLVRSIRGLGSVPVLSTLPPVIGSGTTENRINRVNAGIAAVAKEEKVPLINLWRGLTSPGMLNNGLSADGLHLSSFPHDEPVISPVADIFSDSVVFSKDALRYGANRRNLIYLQTLAKLDKTVRGLATIDSIVFPLR